MAGEIVRIFCEIDPSYYLTDRNGSLVMAKANAADPHQQWVMDTSWWSGTPKDRELYPGFAFKNKASDLALKHAKVVEGQPVTLGPFDPHDLNEPLVWTAPDVGNNYSRIRPVDQISLTLHVKDSHISDGSSLFLYPWINTKNQRWKITTTTTTVHVYCEADCHYCLSETNDAVILARLNPFDSRQQWIVDTSWEKKEKDEAGFPAFALINKSSGQALRHDKLVQGEQIMVGPYIPQDVSNINVALWTRPYVRNGYDCIRAMDNITLNMDAEGGIVRDGTKVILYGWNNGKNQHWKFVHN